MATRDDHFRQTAIDYAAAGIALAFAAAVALFSLKHNDIWWLLGVGRHLVETRSFITTDPFTFTLAGSPWTPQSYLSAIVFYLVHAAAGPAGLIVLRALLVTSAIAVSLRVLSRVGVSWAMASPLVVFVVLIAHTRFIVRAHLFEYVFLAITMGFLLTAHKRRGKSFFVLPAVVQVLWTNMHPSFLLGPALVVLYFAGEWLSAKLEGVVGFVKPLHRHEWKRVGLLVAIVAAACFVNPNPAAFLSQPLGGEQRELMSRFTLEWKSPFDPAIAAGNFHPYYEILLGVAALALVLRLGSLPLAALFLLAATAYLSTQSHRFRVEFALVALPLVAVLVKGSPLMAIVSRWSRGRGPTIARVALAVVAAALVAWTARERIDIDLGVKARFPDRALEFVAEHDIGHRPFNTIGYGSYMVWKLYGQRGTFIDGRNFDPGLYRDFLMAQTNRPGLEQVVAKYRLDAFVIPAVELSDPGMMNVHKGLLQMAGWTPVLLDETAYVYVNEGAAGSEFVDAYAFRHYHPLTIASGRVSEEALDGMIVELERAVRQSPGYLRLWRDLGMAHEARGNHARAVEVLEQTATRSPDDPSIWGRLAAAAARAGDTDTAIDAYTRAANLAPAHTPFLLGLAEVHGRTGNTGEAVRACERAIALEPINADAYNALFRLHAGAKRWDEVLRLAERAGRALPGSHLGHFFAAQAMAGMGRGGEAIRRGEEAVRTNPRAVDARMFLARRYIESGDLARALEHVDAVLSMAPQNTAALDMRGQLEKTMGR